MASDQIIMLVTPEILCLKLILAEYIEVRGLSLFHNYKKNTLPVPNGMAGYVFV